MVQTIQRILHIFGEALFPRRCRVCSALFIIAQQPAPESDLCDRPSDALQQFYTNLMRPYLCPDCCAQSVSISGPLCTCCGTPQASGSGPDQLCGACMLQAPSYDRARALGSYENVLKTLIQRLKYGGCVELAVPLGRLLWVVYNIFWEPDRIDAVVPVPLHPRKLRQRGFNQSELMLRSWIKPDRAADAAGPGLQIRPALLERKRWTHPQAGLAPDERRRNVSGAFYAPRPLDVDRILLVDDVITTGETVAACCRTLRKAGAAGIDVLTVARAVQS